MILVGLGEAGKNIATLFKPHSKNYKIIILDENDGIDKKDSVEQYDEDPIKFKHRGLKSHDEAILFVCGSGKIAGASLRVLEALKAYKTTVCYIVPDLEFASKLEQRRHRVHFGVLQEYTRSGMLHEMIVLDNKILFEIAGHGSASNYYEKVNFFIYNTIQNLMYMKHVDPTFGKLHEKKDISRISTIGVGSLDTDDEKLLYNLANITESMYMMNVEEEDMDNDQNLIPTCQQIVRENKRKERDTSFAIWLSDTENHFYSAHYTHFIQEENKTSFGSSE
tara:strand:- start:22445 stop:23281 length:837 start_codon:yes stop_codon:yes gene_type:complete